MKLGQTVSFTCVAGGTDVLAELISSPRPPAGIHCRREGDGTSSREAVEAKVVKSGGSDGSLVRIWEAGVGPFWNTAFSYNL